MLVECKKSKHHGFFKKEGQCKWCEPEEPTLRVNPTIAVDWKLLEQKTSEVFKQLGINSLSPLKIDLPVKK